MALVIDDTIISNQEQNLRAAMSTDPNMRKVIQQHIREALRDARREVMQAFPAESDPRQSRRAIRTTVYQKILGGNINILTGRKVHGTVSSYEPPRTLQPGQRGGNRRPRGARTKQIMEYGPLDRGFVLRFVNSGTRTRAIGFRNSQRSNRSRYESVVTRIHSGETTGTGNRGAIAPRNWFMPAAESNLGTAAAVIAELISIEAAAITNGE